MSLGDLFPEGLRGEFAKRNIDLGSAILIKLPDFDVNYDKYIVVASKDPVEEFMAYVVINSEINLNVAYSAYLKSLHVPISKAENPFLRRDSFVDCSKLREFPIAEVIEFLKRNPDRAIGNVSSNDFREIQNRITIAKTIEPFLKRKYGFL